MVVSLPVYKKFVGETSAMPDFWFKYLYIKLKNPNDKNLIKSLWSKLYSLSKGDLESYNGPTEGAMETPKEEGQEGEEGQEE